METAERILPHVNASLNAIATVLLITGFLLIKQRHESAHKWTMISCFAVSVLFLISYLFYHYVVKQSASTPFPIYPHRIVRTAYRIILVSHILLAPTVPFLAGATIFFGLRDRRAIHRRLAWWAFPIWLYVSVTGVVVYLMLYQLYPPRAVGDIMRVPFVTIFELSG